MSGQQVKVLVPPPVAMPRGAFWAAAVIDAIAGMPRIRLRRHAASGAQGRADQPRNAVELLALARSVESESPGLAAELRGFALLRGASR
jgi:hypothetical protein